MVVEFGKENRETVMLIHGGGLSWWNFRKEAMLLSDRFHVVLPVIEGHGGNELPFVSVEDSAARLIEYVRNNCGGKITALCGLSLGAQIAVEMISQCPDICENAVIESAAVIPDRITGAMIGPAFSSSYGLIKKKWFAKLQFSSLHMNKEFFTEYFEDTKKIGKEDMIRFMKASTDYSLKDNISETQAVIRVVVGEREQRRIKMSAKMLEGRLHNAAVVEKKGLYHGEYSLNYPEEYVRDLLELIDDSSINLRLHKTVLPANCRMANKAKEKCNAAYPRGLINE